MNLESRHPSMEILLFSPYFMNLHGYLLNLSLMNVYLVLLDVSFDLLNKSSFPILNGFVKAVLRASSTCDILCEYQSHCLLRISCLLYELILLLCGVCSFNLFMKTVLFLHFFKPSISLIANSHLVYLPIDLSFKVNLDSVSILV